MLPPMPPPQRFPALLAQRDASGAQQVVVQELSTDDLMPGGVLVRVTHSTVNYKDGLAVTGARPVIRRWPMIPGGDLCGEVVTSADARFRPGEWVILNGWGAGETHYGGYAGYARVDVDWLVRKPAAFTPAQAMALGTAGYTAMLAVMALERHGIVPARGPVLVSGAAGGVGSVAVALLATLGYRVIASTGRAEEHAYLARLGAAEVLPRVALAGAAKPLDKERWAGAVDTVGYTILANILAMTKAGGAVAACGNAAGMDFPASVAPFILRGVSLLGINSVTLPTTLREEAWARLAATVDRETLAAMTTNVRLADVPDVARRIVAGEVRGRVVVEIA
jgi:acrylyl-CoA reductase (NADPH)